ncbi:hypothetical protein SAMN05421833_109124 [Microbispora rosea]|uniref:YdbS-like PH domain-containing protein n=1 Tax=Microbispora rosea TaxID=58117 RepID=A0A1N7B3T1_9ACTN|nr:PH domain-containing protein [Microbispora rosea]GIH50971.1 membrane protein [Microbispora rosea subsp. rosea]SIR46009.1 hypothetical protein SAMN05421833_109124 [Microbispora rosea]
MSDLRLRPPRNRVACRSIGWWSAQAAVFALPLPLTFAILWASIPPTRELFMWLTLISLVPGLLYVAVMPYWRYRVHRWEVTGEAVYAASGWLWQQWRVVPLSRVQTVDTLRGPLQQLFGLSGVSVTTASSSAVRINGLDREIGDELVAYLTSRTHVVPGDNA